MFQELLKIAFLVATAPIWVPFLKAMWGELQDLFADDGGLFGDAPGPRQREELAARRAERPSPVVHEWLAHVRESDGVPSGPVGGAVPAAARPRGPAAARSRRPGTAPRGFR